MNAVNPVITQLMTEAQDVLVAQDNATGPSLVNVPPIGRRVLLPEEAKKINEFRSKLKRDDAQSIVSFAVDIQKPVADHTSEILSKVKTKDSGPVGDLLTDLSLKINSIDTNFENGIMAKVFGIGNTLKKFKAKYENMEKQFLVIERDLASNRMQMLEDITWSDKMYKKLENWYREIEYAIFAVEETIREENEINIPEATSKAEATKDMIDAQTVRKMIAWRDDLERKLHNLKITQQMILQGMGSQMIIQENDKSLADSLQDGILNSLPLLKIQVAQAITVENTKKAATAKKNLREMNNKLLEMNAKNLREANSMVKTEIEKGMVEVSALEKAQADIIGAISDSIAIAAKGKADRAEAEKKLAAMQEQLRAILSGNTPVTEIVLANTK